MSSTQNERLSKCPRCGSTYFVEAEYRQYIRAYSSAPGGELCTESSAIQVRVCMCGNPVLWGPLKGLSADEKKSVEDSLRKSAEYWNRSEPEQLVAHLRDSFVTQAEFEKLVSDADKLGQVAAGVPVDVIIS